MGAVLVSMADSQSTITRRVFRRISIAFEFALTRRWKRQHQEIDPLDKAHPTVGEMVSVDIKNTDKIVN
jgi:hypothetical protein